MKRSEAARYARWSALIAVLLAALTIGVYVRHGVVARIIKRGAPPAPAENVERQSAGLTFSKVEGNVKVFTVEASKSTEFRNQDASLLEEVKITIFGKQSDRHDVIRTHSCQYTKGTGSVSCNGVVQFDLQSAANATLAEKNPAKPPASEGHVETRNVTFNQASGTAQTNERVTFSFPAGTGEALGVEYNSQVGTLKLLRDVQMSLIQSGGPKGANGEPVHVTGSSLDFSRETRIVQLFGPAHAETKNSQLDAGEFSLHLDEDFRAQELIATPGAGKTPQATTSAASALTKVNANVLKAWFHPDGWLKRLEANGHVRGSRKAAAENDDFSAENVTVEMWPEITEPKQIDLDGSAVISSAGPNGTSRSLETDKARLQFTEANQNHPSQPKQAETLASGTIRWTDQPPNAKDAQAHTHLSADKLLLDFADGNPSLLTATGNVQTERDIPGNAPQTSTAARAIAQLETPGGWSKIELHENVKFKDADRAAQADNAVIVRATQVATLTGHAMVRDATSETHAANLHFVQTTGDISADGGVRSTTFGAKNSPGSAPSNSAQNSSSSGTKSATPQLASGPASISSEKMEGNSKTGRALYSGHARLWQGDSVLESETIELLQKTRELKAAGNVRAVFPQQPSKPTGTPATQTVSTGKSTKPNLWHLSSKTLTYEDLEDRAHLEGNVLVQSETQRMRSDVLDLYFTHAQNPPPAQQASAKSPDTAKQISRAIGSGNVTVEEQTRKATAEHAEYTAADGKFVMSGGKPTIYDGSAGTTTGRQLTFFLADDTIIVDSENGSRTLTKHRVEK